MKIKFPIHPALAVIFMAAALAGGCSRGKGKPEAAAAPVLVAQAFTTNVPVQIDPPPVGHVVAYSSVTIRPQVGGIISEVNFKEGQTVNKGDLLFTIDSRATQAALDAARAALARDTAQRQNAQIQFDREQKLFEQKLVSQDEFDTSKAALDALIGTVTADGAAVTNAQLNLEFTKIRAPFDGRTGSLQFHEGNVVKAPDDTLLTINQIHPIYVVFAVAERYLPVIKKQLNGKPLAVTAVYENLEGPPPQGELTFIDNTVDTTTGTILLKATFANEDNELWPGQFVQVTLKFSELTNAIVVPSQAVQTGQKGQFIYVVKPNPTNATIQIVENRPVSTGVTYQGETVVGKGLVAGETVVTDGQLRLAPGATVSIKNSAPAATTMAATNEP
ncbi:MAG TPA: efflux RND transporter periplasmic adaptor subunit [Verrucomicrobiae bacterium]|nr:efflux RND transporter periplasmic adaptor subunit [Verrucomicrobiae bacterium]